MNDSPPEVRELYRQMLLRRTGAERLAMACGMFDAARLMMRASLGDPEGEDHSAEMRVQLFLRTYGRDFDAEAKARIVNRLRTEKTNRHESPER